jgi:hypothetical protein
MKNISEVYTYRGLVRNESTCSYKSDWEAYECHGLVHKMMIIESMDDDTETRRLSPVAVFSDNNLYVDLINGPADHGWCSGFTCQKRASTFLSIVASHKNFDVYLTSSPPLQLRFRVLFADPSTFSIRVSMYYSTSSRIDLYKNGAFIIPTNGDMSSGSLVYNDYSNNLDYYMPTYLNASGTNLFVKEDRKIYFTLSGGDYIDLKIVPVLVLQFGLPATLPDSFFNPSTLVQNFALLLGLNPSQIKRVNVIRENSRRRRDTSASSVSVSMDISNDPVMDATNADAFKESGGSLNELTATIQNQVLTGELKSLASELLNVTISSFALEKPVVSAIDNTKSQSISPIGGILIVNEVSGCRAQSPCDTQPMLAVVDTDVYYFNFKISFSSLFLLNKSFPINKG